ncbi:hypothetical protein NFX46_39365 [Streptomyces phaeoluteigriseus]|uniref:Uncharacterized protein n=1 Tax=Streptomyces phaeoluteigriseus TaxID=114686 RepID=A0ABY4ZLM0_9ACTN|nr:hypothetical protein [Streptomyces phaeoluteigriseus]USQ89268.1 hypothetical protein NFX46_39365 [Streptomyces phaeoluteigriseus]
MPRWAVMKAHGEAEAFRYAIHRELEGTESQALAEMLRIVDTFAEAFTEAGRHRQKRRVFRVSERSYVVRVENRLSNDEAHFTLAELIADTHDDALPNTVGGSPKGP